MHAVVVTVSIAEGQFEGARNSLNEVVSRVRSAPGVVKGYWTASTDRRSGLSIVVFKTEEDAKNAANVARSNPTPPGVTIGNVEVREVVAEA
jgi:hypothetical protein